jgi:cobalt-zinc-cadmium efflux system membrane fusion protein
VSKSINGVGVVEVPAARTGPRLLSPSVLARGASNLLVLLALGGLAWWGHHTGWKLPKFSALAGQAGEENDDWCKEHAVAETVCVECNPTLLPRRKSTGWCAVHGVHECPFEHPDVAQLPSPPTVTAVMLDRARRALSFAERPENNRRCKLSLRRIQFASDEAVAKAGVDVAPAWEAPVTECVRANGEVTYDQTRVARLASRLRGTVWRVDRALGQEVHMGDVLALVDAREVGMAKAELLQAVAQVAVRSKTVSEMAPAYTSGSLPAAQYRLARANLEEAQIRAVAAEQALANLGLTVRADDLKGLTREEMRRRVQLLGLPEPVVRTLTWTTTANLLPVVAPLDGVVVAREVVAGEVVDDAKTLFVLADPTRMWLRLSVRLEDAGRLAPGQLVVFRPDGGPEVSGKITWISTAVDRRTRTVQARAEVNNAGSRLRDSTFGRGRVILRHEPEAVVVPSEAVQWEGDCHVVFVRDKDYLKKGSPKVFHTRTVRPGATDGGNTEVIAGLLPGELVVTRGSGVLRSELLKNNLGEG